MSKRPDSPLFALFKMNARDFLRNRIAAVMSFLFPLVFVVTFGLTASGNGEPQTIRLAVVDLAHDASSGEMIPKLDANALIETRVLDTEAAVAAYRSGQVDASVVIPRDALSGRPCRPPTDLDCRVVVYANASMAPVLESMLTGLAASTTLENYAIEQTFALRTIAPEQASGMFLFILPGIIALALLQLGLMGTATPLMVARDSGTLAHLASTPLSPLVMLAAQLLLRLVIGMIQVALILAIAIGAFHVKLAHPWLVIPVVVLGGAMMIAIGYAVAGLAPSREAGFGLVMLLNFAMLFLGAVFFAPSGALAVASRLSPISYLSDAIRQLALGVDGTLPLAANLLVMAAWTAVAVGLAMKTFRFDMKESR